MNRFDDGGAFNPEIALSSSAAVECSTNDPDEVLPIEGRLRSEEGVARNVSRRVSGRSRRSSGWDTPV